MGLKQKICPSLSIYLRTVFIYVSQQYTKLYLIEWMHYQTKKTSLALCRDSYHLSTQIYKKHCVK